MTMPNVDELSFDDLPDEAVARSTDPGTSWAAANSVDNLRSSQRAVLEVVRQSGPCHDELLAKRYERLRHGLDLPKQSPSGLRSRRAELVAGGFLRDSGLKAKTAGGRKTIVWALA